MSYSCLDDSQEGVVIHQQSQQSMDFVPDGCDTEGDRSRFNSEPFEAMLAARLQSLQAFVLEEVARVLEPPSTGAVSPGPRFVVRRRPVQPIQDSLGFADGRPPQPPLPLTPELLSRLEDISTGRAEAQSTVESPGLTPVNIWSAPQTVKSLDSLPSLCLSPRRAGIKKSPSCTSWRTSDDEESQSELTKSVSVRKSSTFDRSRDKVIPPEAFASSEGGAGTTSDSLKSQNLKDPTLENIRTTKLEEVLAVMYHYEMDGMDGRTSAESLGFRVRFINDSNFQSIGIDIVLTVFVFLNIVTMGLRTELYKDAFVWDLLDIVFVTAFSLALLLRIVGQGLVETLLKGPDRNWNWFEAVQITVGWMEVCLNLKVMHLDSGIVDPSFFALLRMVRMIRITRILRICRLQIFSELLVMVVGTLGGMKTLIWAVALTAVPMYALSIMFRETLGENGGEAGSENFGNFQMAFFTVFRCTVSGECSDSHGRPIMKLVAEQDGWGYVAIFCLMEFFMTFGLYNVVQGIFLENVLAGAKTNELTLKRERLRNQAYFAEKMAELLTVVVRTLAGCEPKSGEILSVADLLVAAADLSITPEGLDKIRKSPEVITVLKELTVSDEDMMYLFETLDSDGDGHIDLHEFVEGIWKLRGGPRRSDVIANGFMLQKVMTEIQEQGASTSAMLAQHERLLRILRKAILGEAGQSLRSPRGSRRKRSVPRLLLHQNDGSVVTVNPPIPDSEGRTSFTTGDRSSHSGFSRSSATVESSEG